MKSIVKSNLFIMS